MINQVSNYDELRNPGDWFYVNDGIIISCPKCNRYFSLRDKSIGGVHNVTRNPLNITPSILCPFNRDNDNPKCSNHFFITNGNYIQG